MSYYLINRIKLPKKLDIPRYFTQYYTQIFDALKMHSIANQLYVDEPQAVFADTIEIAKNPDSTLIDYQKHLARIGNELADITDDTKPESEIRHRLSEAIAGTIYLLYLKQNGVLDYFRSLINEIVENADRLGQIYTVHLGNNYQVWVDDLIKTMRDMIDESINSNSKVMT